MREYILELSRYLDPDAYKARSTMVGAMTVVAISLDEAQNIAKGLFQEPLCPPDDSVFVSDVRAKAVQNVNK